VAHSCEPRLGYHPAPLPARQPRAERTAGAQVPLGLPQRRPPSPDDLVCRTVDPHGRGWRIGIEDPHDPRRVIAVVPVRDGAVATSGAAHRGRHVVDARTGRPPAGVASVTVVTGSLVDADIDATAACAQGPDAARWLAGRPGRNGLVVWADGSTTSVPDAG
jgi:FAD:protein FMN transferase